MSLRDQIFPPGPARDGNILRLGLVGSWESQLLGLGRLTAFLTPRLLSQSHAVDDMGLNVVFLQRHRVEVGLKLVLERAQAPIPSRHNIRKLMVDCQVACATAHGKDWRAFVASQQEYVDLIDQVDPGAATFRYPVDTNAQPWSRRDLVDLKALEAAGREFEDAVLVLISKLTSLEDVPVSKDDAEATAIELGELVRRCRGAVTAQQSLMGSLRGEIDRLAAGSTRRRPRDAAGEPALHAVLHVSAALADRAEAMLNRILGRYNIVLSDAPPEAPLAPAPRLNPLHGPDALKAQQEAQMKWVVDELIRYMRPLAKAAAAVELRSQDWSTPAARQLSLDVSRYRSRLSNAYLTP